MWNWDEHLKKLYPGRISATKARHCYKLTDSDLSELKDVLTVCVYTHFVKQLNN